MSKPDVLYPYIIDVKKWWNIQ